MKRKVSLVLSSGGSRGLAHIGAINELEKQEFEISSISGSSIGAVIGGLHAMGKLPEYTDWVKTINRQVIWGLLDFALSTSGLLKGDKVFDKMKTIIPDMNIEEMRIPFAAVATDLLNEREMIFKSGSFYEAIRASVAIPTVFTPVMYKNLLLVDGGVLNPVPIEYVERKQDDILVVVNLYGDKKNELNKNVLPNNNSNDNQLNGLMKNMAKLVSSGDKGSLGYYSMLTTTTAAMIHKIARQHIERHKPDILINIPNDSANTFDFHKADELIKIGEMVASEQITKYRIL
jgi:NTE family protein